MYNKEISKFKKYRRFVIWGLLKKTNTLRYIHSHFFTTLKKLGTDAIWVEDEFKNRSLIKKGDLVISSGLWVEHLPVVKDVDYCLHNFNKNISDRIENSRRLILQVYIVDAEKNSRKWDTVRFFDRKNQVLYQPWGTNLLPHEFKQPVFRPHSKFIFWIGSIWDNELHQGNINEIRDLKKILRKNGLLFVHFFYGITDFLNIEFIRLSRIAPAIAGKWQVEVNYLPCRMFKNISYGQLGISNVGKFKDIFPDLLPKGNNIEELIDNSLSIKKTEYIEMINFQQEIVKRYTYLNSLLNIVRAFEEIHG